MATKYQNLYNPKDSAEKAQLICRLGLKKWALSTSRSTIPLDMCIVIFEIKMAFVDKVWLVNKLLVNKNRQKIKQTTLEKRV